MEEHKTLFELQQIDTQIDALNNREKNLPERERYQKVLEEAKKMDGLYKSISKKLHDEAAIQKRLEDELNSLNTKIDKEQKRLYSGTISNPKELQGVQQEVTHLKDQADNKELALLEQSEVVDKLRKDDKTVATSLKAKLTELQKTKVEMEKVLAEIKERRDELKAQREPLYKSLGDNTRQLYDRVRAKHPTAVTVLEEGICQGCRVEIPSTDAERIMSSKKLERCPNCSRIFIKKRDND